MQQFCEGIAKFDWGAFAAFCAAFIAAAAVVYGSIKAADVATANQKLATEVAIANQKLATETEVAKLREKWVADLRNDISELVTVLMYDGSQKINEQAQLYNKILLRLNPIDVRTMAFEKELNDLNLAFISNDENKVSLLSRFQKSARVFLKQEWDEITTRLAGNVTNI